jgi:hypothetical protein
MATKDAPSAVGAGIARVTPTERSPTPVSVERQPPIPESAVREMNHAQIVAESHKHRQGGAGGASGEFSAGREVKGPGGRLEGPERPPGMPGPGRKP